MLFRKAISAHAGARRNAPSYAALYKRCSCHYDGTVHYRAESIVTAMLVFVPALPAPCARVVRDLLPWSRPPLPHRDSGPSFACVTRQAVSLWCCACTCIACTLTCFKPFTAAARACAQAGAHYILERVCMHIASTRRVWDGAVRSRPCTPPGT